MGVFDKIGDAKSSQDSNFIRPGDFDAKITECKVREKFNGDKMMLVNMTVTAVREGDHRVGEEITHFLKQSQAPFLANVKQFISSTLQCDPDDVGAAEAERVTGEENPLAGYEVRVKARIKPTQAGNPFTRVFYCGPVGSKAAKEADDSK